MKTKTHIIVIIIILGILTALAVNKSENNQLKIGIITPLSGNSAYWGESTLLGMRLAEDALKKEGIDITFIPEDGKLDPGSALNAAQKLVNIDKVDVIYSEFNPASISVSSFLKGKNIFHLYDSAATSPLDAGQNNFKTYLDYETSCKEAAQYIKDHKNVKRVGVLKMNLEHGTLCLKGIQTVFGTETIVEEYDPGAIDFRVQLTKLNKSNADAVFHASFQPQTLTSIKQMQQLGMRQLFIGLAETITPDVVSEYSTLIEGDVFFGLPPVSKELAALILDRNKNKDVGSYSAAGLAYVHLVQLGHSLSKCRSNFDCVGKEMSKALPDKDVGFEGFANRIAKFDVMVGEWKKGTFVTVN